jgi:N-acetylglucosaminylphosphatidylinositol deacetylase
MNSAIHFLVQTLDSWNLAPSQSCVKVRIIDHKELQDHPVNPWSHPLIADLVYNHIRTLCQWITEEDVSYIDSKNIQINILSFDEYGVSGHSNHIDSYHGVEYFFQSKEYDEMHRLEMEHWNISWKWMTLHSVRDNFIKKYFPIRSWLYLMWIILRNPRSTGDERIFLNQRWDDKDHWSCFTYRPWLNWNIMAKHASQFVWYRRLFVIFSLYSFVNNWTMVIQVDKEMNIRKND